MCRGVHACSAEAWRPGALWSWGQQQPRVRTCNAANRAAQRLHQRPAQGDVAQLGGAGVPRRANEAVHRWQNLQEQTRGRVSADVSPAVPGTGAAGKSSNCRLHPPPLTRLLVATLQHGRQVDQRCRAHVVWGRRHIRRASRQRGHGLQALPCRRHWLPSAAAAGAGELRDSTWAAP